MIKYLLTLVLILTLGFGSMVIIPDSPRTRTASVKMDLPRKLNGWTGEPQEPSKQELEWLAIDTEFEKKNYHQFFSGSRNSSLDGIHVSIVLSGADVNNSIHRPERCMPSQGFKDLKISRRKLEASGGEFTARRIRASRTHRASEDDEKGVTFETIMYYWFVGASSVTDSHYTRTFIDMKERVINGFDQRWAYITVSGVITDGIDPLLGRDAGETDRIVSEFAKKVYEECVIKGEVVTGEPDQS